MTFKAQLKIGGGQSTIKCYIPECLSYPEDYESARVQWLLFVRAEKSKMASKMAARNKCNVLLCKNWCTDLMYIVSSN